MDVLKVEHLKKEYSGFCLDDVSFCVKKATVMGFTGRNGAGKTTTLKSIMNIAHASGGRIEILGLDMSKNEEEIKQRIGFAQGTADYYKKKKIKKILDVTKRFYKNWDDSSCKKYMELFSLDEEKTPSELSEGMKVKLSLLIALSHKAELLILDEPTSGLDPISRVEILEIFKHLRSQGVSILFSTHITSDLERCADGITYIRDGKIVYTGSIEKFAGNRSLEEVMIEYEKEAFCEKFAL